MKKNYFFILLALLISSCYRPVEPVSVQPQIPENKEEPQVRTGFDATHCKEQWCRTKVSFYGKNDGFAGQKTASGERFDPTAMTVAHKTLKFGTNIRFKNPKNGREIVARVNDLGPHVAGREFDLSYSAAQTLGLVSSGVASLEAKIE